MRTSSRQGEEAKSVSQAANHVVCAVDSDMSYALSILLSSLATTRQMPFHVTVGYLDDALPGSEQEFLKAICKELHIQIDFLPLEARKSFISQGHISPTTFAKFLLADAIQGAHLWLDADTIALPGWDGIFRSIYSASPQEGLIVAARGNSPEGRVIGTRSLAFNAGILGFPKGIRRDWENPLASVDMVDTQEQFLFYQLYAHTAIKVSEKFNLLTYRVDSLDPHDMPYIIHYAGAHKPWHLRRDMSQSCMDHRCPWSAWFEAEEEFFDRLRDTSLLGELKSRQHQALITGRVKLRRDHSGYNFLRLLTAIGPLAPIVVNLLTLLKQWVPRGTHPIH